MHAAVEIGQFLGPVRAAAMERRRVSPQQLKSFANRLGNAAAHFDLHEVGSSPRKLTQDFQAAPATDDSRTSLCATADEAEFAAPAFARCPTGKAC